jgi:hypothetical protein
LPLHQHASRVHGVLGVIRSFQFSPRANVLAVEPAVDRVGGLFSSEHRRHHYVGAGHAIATGEHTGQFCRQRQGIGMERSPFSGCETQPLSQRIHVGDLSNRGYDSVAGNDKLRTWNRRGSRPSAGIGTTELHLRALQAGDASARAGLE